MLEVLLCNAPQNQEKSLTCMFVPFRLPNRQFTTNAQHFAINYVIEMDSPSKRERIFVDKTRERQLIIKMVWHYPAKRNCNPGSTNDEMRAGELVGRRSERSKINKLT